MDKRTVSLRFLEGMFYVLKIERAKPVLSDFYVSNGMPEDELESYIETRTAAVRMSVLIVAIGMIALGFAASKFLGHMFIGRVGSWVMYTGLIFAAIQYKRQKNGPTHSLASIRELLKK